jgi:hypothetical protein
MTSIVESDSGSCEGSLMSLLSKKLLKLNGVSSVKVDVIAPETTCANAGVDLGLWGVDGSAGRIRAAEGTGKDGILVVGCITGIIPTGCGGT